MSWVDVEVMVSRVGEARYEVQLRSWRLNDITMTPPKRAVTTLDQSALFDDLFKDDMVAYGQRLAEVLFPPGDVLTEWTSLRNDAEASGTTIRLRLVIDDSAFELHNLRWETLRDLHDPKMPRWLVANQRVLFSRLLPSRLSFKLRSREDLNAVVFISNPAAIAANPIKSQRGDRKLKPIDVDGERARARDALKGVAQIAEIASDPATASLATADRLVAAIKGGADIVYLVAHGALVPEGSEGRPHPKLYLDKPGGGVDEYAADQLVQRIADLERQPSLVVLVSCQSAGAGDDRVGDDGALAALGPSLARAGVGAVVAMQGNVLMKTMAAFTPTLLRELLDKGEIDRALAAARDTVRDAVDGWMPALFLRLRGGQIWYTPGFAGDEFTSWDTLQSAVLQKSCLPVIGMATHQRHIGSTSSLVDAFARRAAAVPPLRGSQELPRLAQFLAATKKRKMVLDTMACALIETLAARNAHIKYGDLATEKRPWSMWNRLLVETWAKDERPHEPHRLLAKLELPIFVTTNPDDLLTEALREAKKKPEVAILRWNERMGLDPKTRELVKTVFDREPGYVPTPERPLVFHLFGHAEDPESIVLTEDDHFDYLLWFQGDDSHVPECLAAAWSVQPLLFLGFELGDWHFRVMLRSVLDEQRSKATRDFPSVAAQVEPQDAVGDPARARRWLESYFQGRADVRLFWGSVDDFAAALAARLATRNAGAGG